MSYILDALKKSDQQRQHGKAPTLLTVQNTPEASGRHPSLLYAGLVVTLFAAGLAIAWLRPWQTEAPVRAIESIPAQPVATVENAATSLPAMPAAQISHQASPPRSEVIPAQAALNGSTERPKPIESMTNHKRVDSSVLPAKESNANPQHSQGEKGVLTMGELPASVRQGLPDILIAFHQFSSAPNERRVMINNSVMRQGDSIAPGLKLEQITPDGVVLSFQGYQFQRGVR